MTFTSYSQNYEDVMLWRALKHVSNGFYVDIGAAWPDEHSVTKAFYLAGWHGVNIDPVPDLHAKLQERRSRDINLKIAISDLPSSVEMSFIDGTGLSTLDSVVAKTHQAAGWGVMTQLVDVKNLRQVWEEHIPQGQEVQFLKIDIEGLEEAAIRGNDWTNNRPWIVVVEATLPMSQVESYAIWEPLLIEAKYRFVYADGLNRFYVAQEHEELVEAFKYPPNVFDEYKLATQVDAEIRANHAESQADLANERANHAESQAAQYRLQLDAVLNSRSWKISKPLREAGRFARWFVRGSKAWLTFALGSRPRRISRKAAVWVINKVRANPRLKALAITRLNKFPELKQRLKKISLSQSGIIIHSHRHAKLVQPTVNLSPHARQIFSDLKSAMNKHDKEGV